MAWIHVYKDNFFIVSDNQNKHTLTVKYTDWAGFYRAKNNNQALGALNALDLKGDIVHKYTPEGYPAVYRVSNSTNPEKKSVQLINRIKRPLTSAEITGGSIKAITGAKYSREGVKENIKEEKDIELKKMASSVIQNFLKG